jgi:hypothetical protein
VRRFATGAALALALGGCVTPAVDKTAKSSATVTTQGAGCLAGFVRSGSSLASEIARLATPVECRVTDEFTMASTAGVLGESFDDKVASALGAAVWHVSPPARFDADWIAAYVLASQLPEGAVATPLGAAEEALIDGTAIGLSTISVLAQREERRVALVCVIGVRARGSQTGAMICRATTDRSERSQLALARRLVAEDLPAVLW